VAAAVAACPTVAPEHGDRVRERDAAARLDVKDAVLNRNDSRLHRGPIGGD
jgi:hypothetical protein